MKIAVCDDSKEELRHMKEILFEFQQNNTNVEMAASFFSSSDLLITEIENGIYFDIYFLDIIMPGTSGMELAGFLRSLGHKSCIVFTTNSPDYSLQAYAVGAVQYLLKPIEPVKLNEILNDIMNQLQINLANSLIMDTKDGMVKIACHTIMYAEVRNHTTYIHLSDQRVLKSKSMRLPFLEFISPLLSDKRFIKPHNSYVVNMDYINRMTTKEFELSDGRIIPITRIRQKEVRDSYLDYISELNHYSNLYNRGKSVES